MYIKVNEEKMARGEKKIYIDHWEKILKQKKMLGGEIL